MDHLAFQNGQTVVLYVNINDFKFEFSSLANLLTLDEKNRAKRYRFQRDTFQYIFQSAVLRLLLADFLNCNPLQIDIRKRNDGKPFLEDNGKLNIHFNISHSGEFTVFAFNQFNEIGIDIEKIENIPDIIEIVDRYFTNREKLSIHSCTINERLTLFYKFWTRKEAVLKALGVGLLKPLDSVDVSFPQEFDTYMQVQVKDDTYSEIFFVKDVPGPEGYAIALAKAGPRADVLVQQLGPGLFSSRKFTGSNPLNITKHIDVISNI